MAANTSAAPAPAAPAAAPVPAAAGAAPAASGAAPRSVGFASTSLYVGDLAAEVTDAHLFEIFQQVGPVASVRVCRDAATRRSLGYAYVNFHTSVDAERALDTMNFREIRGKACRIMWSQRDPSIRKSGLGNVFVKGLAKSIDHKSLYDSFSIFGNILSCKVSQHPRTKESLGYGFVQFADEQAAEAAIAQANNTSLANQRITVAAFKPKRDRGGNDKARFTNVFVKNIPPSVDSKEKLIELFAKHGEVNSAALTFPPPLPEKKRKDGKTDEKDAKDQKSERTRTAFGFVNFRTPEQATAAVNAMNGFDIGGSKLYVSRAQKKEERERENKERLEKERNERHSKYANTNLYVKNLTDAIDDERLRNEFKQWGAISSSKVMRDTNGKSRGFGFVCFNSPEEATRAVTNMNGVLLDSKPLYVALAQRKEVRRATLEALYARRGTMPVYPFPGVGMVGPVVQQPMYRGGWNGPYVQQPMMPRANRVPYQQMPQQMMQFGGMIPVQPRGPMGAQGAGAGGRGRGGPRMGGGRGGAGSGRGVVPQGAAAGVQPARRPPAAATGQPPQVKYNQNVRNQPQAAAAQPVSQPVQDTQVEVDPSSQPLDSTALAKLPEDQRKQVLGERLFPLIHEKQPELAGKITGMLLEMDNSELLHLLENPQALNEKIDEALHVLKTHDDAGTQ